MNRVQISLPDYLRPPCDQLWKWADNGDAIVWRPYPGTGIGETTAAFTPQLKLILEELLERVGGLPPLTSLLAVIDACGNNWSAQGCMRRLQALSAAATDHRLGQGESTTDPEFQIWEWLAKIHRLKASLRTDVGSQIAIITYAMQDAQPGLSGAAARDVIACVSVFAHERDPNWTESARPIEGSAVPRRAFDALRRMSLQPITAESIELWRETGVGAMPEPASVETPPPRNPIAHALRQLSHDEQWGAIARSAVAAASVLTLPRRPSDPDQLPVGGVSDVSNRGQPERLLMTELAQDPMVMLARIANGQALYLRRETPPGPSPEIRPVLLESGIRTWGATRLKIASIGMAIAAAEERRGESTAQLVTVSGDQWVEESFATTGGIIKHLQRAEPDEHPGEAVEDYLQVIARQAQSVADPIIVISAATDRDQRFRRAIEGLPDGLLVARVERDQSVTLLRRTALGDEVLQSISLESVEPAPRARRPGHGGVRTKDSSLALFLDLDPCPLRFTDTLDDGWFAATTVPGLWTITRDRRLLWFEGKAVGGIQLVDHLPAANVLAYEQSGRRLAMVVGHEDHFLVQADAREGSVDVVKLSSDRPKDGNYEFDNGNLFLFGSQVLLFDRKTGNVKDRISTNRNHIGAAVLVHGRDVSLLDVQGNNIVSHQFHHPEHAGSYALAVRNGANKIVLLTDNLDGLVHLNAESPVTVNTHTRVTLGNRKERESPKVAYRSADQNIVVLEDHFIHPGSKGLWYSHRGQLSIGLNDNTVRQLGSGVTLPARTLLYRFDPRAYQLLLPRNYLSRFTAIEFGYDGTIGFVKQKRKWKLEMATGRSHLMMKPEGVGRPLARFGFGPSQRLERDYGRTHWTLRPITIGNNHVIADNRGLVHLRRGDNGSELTLMLHMDHVSGWASWGEQFGDRYCLGGEMVPVSDTVLHWLEEFAEQCSQ